MTLRRNDQGFVRVSESEFETILDRAAEEGAKRALRHKARRTAGASAPA